MPDARFRAMSRQRDSTLWGESRFEHPNYGDDLANFCEMCECIEYACECEEVEDG